MLKEIFILKSLFSLKGYILSLWGDGGMRETEKCKIMPYHLWFLLK